MENKFYVPEIEEFCEGIEFEYQVYDEDTDTYLDNQWIISRFDSRCGLGHDLTSQVNEGTIRVKYLDKSDIESLGFNWFDKFKDRLVCKKDVQKTENTFDSVTMYVEENICTILISRNIPKGIKTIVNTEEKIVVTIKNKTELRKLLKQLNIL